MKLLFSIFISASLLGAVALNQLDSDWSEEIIYESKLIYGQNIIQGKDNKILILGRDGKVFELSPNNKLELQFVLSSQNGISTIAYQPQSDRYIYLDKLGNLYQYSENGDIKLATMFASGVSSFAIDNDDSIYTCHMAGDAKVQHWDKNGTFISNIADSGNCFQLALNRDTRMLYFSNTVEGSIYQVELNGDNFTEKIVQNVGIQGTYEPIGIALDDAGGVYFFPSNQGLKHYNGSIVDIKDAIGGGGSIIWSNIHEAFLMLQGAGANVLKYNLDPDVEASNLNNPINAYGMAANQDGVFFCSLESKLQFIPHDKTITDFDDIIKDSIINVECELLENDMLNNIYVSSHDGHLYQISHYSKKLINGLSGEPISSLEYDQKNNLLYITTSGDNNSLKIWRVDLETLTASLLLEPSGNYIVRGSAIDSNGNFYFVDTYNNTLYKVDTQTKQLSVFIDNPIDNQAIGMTDLEYLPLENGLLMSQIEDYKLFKLSDKSVSYFAKNNLGVDSFNVNTAPDGKILASHSGRLFYFVPKEGVASYPLNEECFSLNDFESLPNNWSLVGSTCGMNDFSLLQNAQIVWTWDNKNAKWYAYSPNQTTMSIIQNSVDIGVLEKIDPKQGFWIKK